MPASIADLFITVSSDVTGALGGLSAVETGLGRTTTAMASTVPAGLALAGAATAIGAGFLDTIDTAADFEQQINGIKAVMSPTEVLEFGTAIKDLALQLGQDTKYSAIEAAGAIEELIKAGVPLPDILNGGAAAALALAAATGVDVEQAAQFAATAMNTFHLSATQLPDIMDTIANVSNGTAASVGGLQLAFSQIGPVAAGIGISFNDTAQALGIFANNGLQGSDAGTSLKTMLLNLEPSTKSQVTAFKELGLITKDGSNQFFDAEGNAKGLREIFEILKTSTAGLTAEQKINLLQTAFGTDAVRAATIAASEGAAGWDKVTESVDKMGGVVVAAAQRQQGLNGSMEALGGSIDTVKIKIGDLFLPVLTTLVQMLTNVVNAFSTLDPTIQVVIVAAVGIAGAVAGIVAAMVLLTPVITATAASFAVLTAAASPFLIPILAITAAVAALYLAWQTNFGGIRDVTAEVWTAIQPGFANIQGFLSNLGGLVGSAFGAFREALSPVLDALNVFVTGALAGFPGWVRELGDRWNAVGIALQPIGSVLEMVGQAINFLVTGNMDRLVELMQEGLPQPFAAGLQLLRDVITTSIGVMGDLLGGVQRFVGYLLAGDFQGAFDSLVATFGSIKDRIQPLWNEFLLVLGTLLEALPGWIAARIGDVWGLAIAAWGGLSDAFGRLWTAELELIGAMIRGLPGFIAAAVPAIWNLAIQAWGGLSGLFGQLWQAELNKIGELLGQLGGFITSHLPGGEIWDNMGQVFSLLGALVNTRWQEFLGQLGQLIGQIPGAIGQAVSGLGDPWAALVNGAWNLGPRIGDALNNITNFIRDRVASIPGTLTGLGDLFKPIVDAAWGIGQRLGDAVGNFFNFIRDRVAAIPETLTGLGDLFKPVVDAAWGIGQGLGDAVGNFVNFATGAVAGIGTWIGEHAGDIFHGVVDAAWNIGQRLGEAVGNFVNYATGAVAGIGTWIVEHAGDIFHGVVDAAWNIGQGLGDAVGNFVDYATGAVAGIGTWIVENGGNIFKGVVDAAWGIGDGLGDAVGNFVGFIQRSITDLITWVGEHPEIFSAVITAAQNLITKLGEILGPIAEVVGRIFQQIPEWFSSVFGGGQPTPGTDVTQIPNGSEVTLAQMFAALINVMVPMVTVLNTVAEALTALVPIMTQWVEAQTAATGGTTAGGSGPAVVIQNVYISSEAEMQTFYEQMSLYIEESTGRVSATLTAALPSGA